MEIARANNSKNILFVSPPIRLISYKHLKGYNIYHKTSVIRQSVDFGSLEKETSTIAGNEFPQRFLDRFLSLKSMTPNNGMKNEFIDRISAQEGVSIKEVLLEAILAVETSTAFAMHEIATLDYAAIISHESYTDLIWECTIPKISQRSAKLALQGLLELLPNGQKSHYLGNYKDFESSLNSLHHHVRRKRLAPSTSVMKYTAKKKGIPCEILGAQHLLLGEGCLQRYMYASMSDTTSIASQKICVNKHQTNIRLTDLRIPVAKQVKVKTIEEARRAAHKIGYPVVTKPVMGNKGRAVTAGVASEEQLRDAFKKAHTSRSDVLIEQYISGHDYRLLVVGGKFVAAVKRLPPMIIGDGISTVEMLIARLNDDPYRDGFRGFPVDLDSEVKRLLEKNSLALTDILEAGRRVTLRAIANVSTGGVPIDVTDRVHPDIREMAIRSALGVGLDIAGIDYITSDITKSYRETGGAIIEVNARPGLDIHIWPWKGPVRNVADDILKHMFPSKENGRIPIVSVAGDKRIAPPARSLDMILRGAGKTVALVLRKHSYINGKTAELDNDQQTNATRLMLQDPAVDTLISTVSLRRTASRGLQLNRSMVTIIYDKMIEERSELFYQGLDVIAQATTHCYVVGADNRMALDIIDRIGAKRLILVSQHHSHQALQSHLATDQTAVTMKWHSGEKKIVLLSGIHVLRAYSPKHFSSINTRHRNTNDVKSLMYAIAAAYGMGMSGDEIDQAIKFAPTTTSTIN
jgi:cyanophycin synthetase